MEKEKGLDDTLREIVQQYGIEKVGLALQEFHKSKKSQMNQRAFSAAKSKKHCELRADKRKRTKVTAVGFVSKIEVSSETRSLLNELATRYDNKEFLPSIGEIRNFCQIHGIDAPVSSSREVAIRRVFTHLSQMNDQEIQSMIQTRFFSGPARLGPIAEAIRRTAEHREKDSPNFRAEDISAYKMSGTKATVKSKPPIPPKNPRFH